jgi:hypothetical protein
MSGRLGGIVSRRARQQTGIGLIVVGSAWFVVTPFYGMWLQLRAIKPLPPPDRPGWPLVLAIAGIGVAALLFGLRIYCRD